MRLLHHVAYSIRVGEQEKPTETKQPELIKLITSAQKQSELSSYAETEGQDITNRFLTKSNALPF